MSVDVKWNESAPRGSGRSAVERELIAIRRLRERLTVDLGYATGDVDAALDRAMIGFADARIREFIPLLVARLVLDELKGH